MCLSHLLMQMVLTAGAGAPCITVTLGVSRIESRRVLRSFTASLHRPCEPSAFPLRFSHKCMIKRQRRLRISQRAPQRKSKLAYHQESSIRHAAMIDHQAAILHDLYTGFGELFGDRGVTDAKLHPDRFRLLHQ